MDLSVVSFFSCFYVSRLFLYSKLKHRVNIFEVSLSSTFENLWFEGLTLLVLALIGRKMSFNPIEYFNSGASLKKEK